MEGVSRTETGDCGAKTSPLQICQGKHSSGFILISENLDRVQICEKSENLFLFVRGIFFFSFFEFDFMM